MGRNRSDLDKIILEFGRTFEIKVSEAESFCGMEIVRERATRMLYIHQTGYTERILERFNMLNVNPVSIPVEPGVK